METKRWWFVGRDDKTHGPFDRTALAEAVAQGKLREDGLICEVGQVRWQALASLPELTDIPWPPPAQPPLAPPPLPSEGTIPSTGAATQPPAAAASEGGAASTTRRSFSMVLDPADASQRPRARSLRPGELEEIPGWRSVLLSVPTLGLWGIFQFYSTMRVHQRVAGVVHSNAETLFWAYLGALAIGIVTAPFLIGWMLLIAAVVIGATLLREALRLRDLAVIALTPAAAHDPNAYPPLKSDDWHFGLWVTGAVLCVTLFGAIVGVPILIAQALAWFEDHNRLANAARARVGAMHAAS